MALIATHDSATGEKPKNILSYLFIPFARTQSKNIREQYYEGCRMFDIRVRRCGDKWHCAHGLFLTKRTFEDIIEEINAFPFPCHVSVTYEGRLKTSQELASFIAYMKQIEALYTNILWGACCVKYADGNVTVDWTEVIPAKHSCPPCEQAFLPLDGRRWQTFIPIPWLWKQFYFKHVDFNEEVFKFVDFL